tara:strand:- start:268 stop:489 length:222 start_codon:yes stop_codon:yes gene_type:complete
MEYYNSKENEFWVFQNQVIEKPKRNNKKYTLRLCKSCNKTWEIDCTKSIVRYKGLPTYGLERKTCKYCKKENE